jgi:hypothetical protein
MHVEFDTIHDVPGRSFYARKCLIVLIKVNSDTLREVSPSKNFRALLGHKHISAMTANVHAELIKMRTDLRGVSEL